MQSVWKINYGIVVNMSTKRPEKNEKNETYFRGKRACNEKTRCIDLKSENTELITPVKTRSDDIENNGELNCKGTSKRVKVVNTDEITTNVATRDECRNIDVIHTTVTTSRDEVANADEKTIHATTSRDEVENNNKIKTYVTTSRDEVKNNDEKNIHAATSDENINIDDIRTNVTTIRRFNKDIDDMVTQVITYRDGIKHNDCMKTHSKSSQDGTEYTDGMGMHLTSTDRAQHDTDTSIDIDQHTECMETHSKFSSDGTDTRDSINVDGITHSNSDIVHSEKIDSRKYVVKKKGHHKNTKVHKPNCSFSPCKNITLKLFESIGITETEVIKDLKFYLDKKYVFKELNILDEDFLLVQFKKESAKLFYHPNEKNKDNYLLKSPAEQLSFNKDEIKEFKKSGKVFTIETRDKSIALKIHDIKGDHFVCSVSIELNLRFELFKHIKGSERLQVTQLHIGTLNENNIFVLKLNDIYAHLEFIHLFGLLGVTEEPKENNELEKNCIFLEYRYYIYKMTLHNFYIKFYAVLGQRWPDAWYDDNKKPQNPPDVDIVNYRIPNYKQNKDSNGCKGLIDCASRNFFKLCKQYFAGYHTTYSSDESSVAEGTLLLAMTISESIRNHNTVLINIIMIKLHEIYDFAPSHYLQQHPMLFGRTWPNRNKTGFKFNPRPETLKRENSLFDQYLNINPLLKEEKNIVKLLESTNE